MQDIHKGKVIRKKDGTLIFLEELSFIFDCPDCEYFWTAFDEEGILSCRNVHNATVHPKKHISILYDDAVKSVKQEYVAMYEKVMYG